MLDEDNFRNDYGLVPIKKGLKALYKKKIEALRDAALQKSDDLIVEELDSFVRACQLYTEKVVSMERVITLLRFTLDPEEYRLKVQEIDRARRIAHDALISRVDLLNRIAQMFGQEMLLDYTAVAQAENQSEREVVARMAGEVMNEYFTAGVSKKSEE